MPRDRIGSRRQVWAHGVEWTPEGVGEMRREPSRSVRGRARPGVLGGKEPPLAPTASQPLNQLVADFPNLERLLDVQLPVIAILAEKEMQIRQILQFDVGSVIVFPKHDSDPITLRVNNVVVGSGKTIKVGDHFGLHLRAYSQKSVVKSLQ